MFWLVIISIQLFVIDRNFIIYPLKNSKKILKPLSIKASLLL